MLRVVCIPAVGCTQAAAKSGIEAERRLVESQLREEDARLQLAAGPGWTGRARIFASARRLL